MQNSSTMLKNEKKYKVLNRNFRQTLGSIMQLTNEQSEPAFWCCKILLPRPSTSHSVDYFVKIIIPARQQQQTDATAMETKPSFLVLEQTCQRFSLDEIRSATQNFDEELVVGRGGFGKVYKGQIKDGSSAAIVAIKRLHSMSDQGAPEFRAEVEMLSKLRHCNLVSLIGYCNEGAEMVLVYDYMPHGTLEESLHKDGANLSWLQLLKICIGAGRGLDYLHTGTGTQHGVIHRDVKSSNILLDENFAAKISDFGLAKVGPTNQTRTYVSTGVKGTFGYMDPCYFFTGKLTRKSDVYSYGVILLEVMCGRPAVDTSLDEEQWGLAAWAQDRIKEGKLNKIVDFRLRGQISNNCLKDFARIACRCLHNQPNQRPTMAETIARLEHILSVQVRIDSSVTEGKFIDKVRLFFSTKVQPKSSQGTIGSEGEPSDKLNNEKLTVTTGTGTSKVDSGSKVTVTSGTGTGTGTVKVTAPQLVHLDNTFSYTYEDLLYADAELISKSSYWTTYRATMGNGNQLLVRRLDKRLFRKEDILTQIPALGKLSHICILVPKAYYYGEDEALYVSDYIKNGSVASFIHPSEGQKPKPIDWLSRMNMIISITRGLVYLHKEENTVHGNLTSRHVFLDDKYHPLIADVGISLLARYSIPNLPLNHAPELTKFSDANMKTDVYGLGLIILEFLTRKSPDLKVDGINLSNWVMSMPREKWRAEVFDPTLKREYPNIKQDLVRMLEIAMACVSRKPNARPEALEVLEEVTEIYGPSMERVYFKSRVHSLSQM